MKLEKFRMSFDHWETESILSGKAKLIIRDVALIHKKRLLQETEIIGLETFSRVGEKIFFYNDHSANDLKAQEKVIRWRPPFAMADKDSRFRLVISNVKSENLKNITDEEFAEAGTTKVEFQKLFGRRFEHLRWVFTETGKVDMIWFKLKMIGTKNNS